MHWLALLVAAPVLLQGEVKPYVNGAVGMTLEFPAAWQIKAVKDDAAIEIPLNAGMQAKLEILAVAFSSEPDIWQISQKHVNEQMKREVERQWTEEVLGVPLLMTKVNVLTDGAPEVILVALMYSATPKKFLFRLSSPAAGFEEAEFAWRRSLQSLRTVSGDLPKPEDPENPAASLPTGTSSPSRPSSVIVLGSKPSGGSREVAPMGFPVETAGRKYEIRVPDGWRFEPKSASEGLLKNDAVPGGVEVRVASPRDSEPPARAFQSRSAESLNLFESVQKREENRPSPNKAGFVMGRVWRMGRDASGPLATLDAVGAGEEVYWVVRFRLSGQALTSAVQASLEALVKAMSVEPAP